nr:MAG TPA: nuclear pore complex protein [Caudoviricetes sp.]
MAYESTRLKRFKFWCQLVLPLVYDDSLSYYEILCKLTDYLNKVIDNQNDISEYLKQLDTDVETMKQDITYLKSEIEKVKNGDYVSLYLDSIIKWIDENLQELVGRIVKYVFFVIDDDGYFNALIPYAWQFIQFDTGFDSSNKNEFLHLILEW